MSHEIITRPLPIINPESEYEWYYYIPLLNRKDWDGIEYDSVKYGWEELDYRFDMPYPSIPEPSTIGFIMGLIALACIAYKQFTK